MVRTVVERKLLCLPLDGLYYGFELSCIIETAQDVQITRLPCLPPDYCGVCGRKGAITPVVSLARMVGKTESGTCRHPVTVMLRSGEYECGILAEEEPVILDLSNARQVQEEQSDFTGQRCLIREIWAAEEGVVLVVDVEATLEGLVASR